MDRPQDSPADLVVGLSGAARNACVTVCSPDRILGTCEQERITRVRAAGFNRTGLPDEALDELLHRAGRGRKDVSTYVTAEEVAPPGARATQLDHHFGHACAAFLPSPFESAAILICDHESPEVSVWEGNGSTVTRVDWPWRGIGFAEFYSQCAEVLGFTTRGKEQRLEALARLSPSEQDSRATGLVEGGPEGLQLAPDWRAQLEHWAVDLPAPQDRVQVAAALQSRIGDLLVQFAGEIRRRLSARRHLCVGGSLFSNSYLNSRLKQCGAFDDVFVPVNPGNAGLSLGVALHASRQVRHTVSPFLGPSYSPEEIKATLDNCKLTYRWEADSIGIAVEALRKGLLVGWFDGAMEWGPRALGARSILADPFAPYVLDNLNRFLKQRESWRGYALSGLSAAVREQFDGPAASPFMESDFVPRDRERFRHVLPGPAAAVRIQSVVPDQVLPRFHALLEAFGAASGIPMVVNTSFNGFQEPIVCSPRDAIRVFFGTGIDVLVLGQFVVAK